MNNPVRLVAAIATFVTGTLTPLGASAADDQRPPAIVMVDMSPAEQAATLHVVGLFAEGGLELPDVTLRRYLDRAACGGLDGIHRSLGTHSEIDICTADPGPWRERVILHELAHAWAAHHLTPARKEAFRTVRGYKYWDDYNRAKWEDVGAEQAAEIIVWALSDHRVQVIKIDRNTCPELRAAYKALTGLAPLHQNKCEPQTPTDGR